MSLLTTATLVVTPNANKTSKLYSVIPSNGNGDFTVTRATEATRVNSSGLVEVTGTGMVRRDYSLASCPNLLLEPQRTNSVFYSEQFDNVAWMKSNVTATPNSINSPSGVLNADFIIPNTTNSTHSTNNSTASVTAGVCTYSIFAKKGFYKNILVWFDVHSGGIGVNLETLAIFRNSNITSYTIDNYGNDWVRISITANIAATAIPAIYIYSNDVTPQISWAANGTGGLYVWGAQVEKTSSYATSYIPTTTASVTRNADSISLGNVYTNGLISASGGTWFVELRNNVVYTGGITIAQLLGLGNDAVGATANNIFLSCSSGGRIRVWKQIAGTLTPLYLTSTDTSKVAIKWNGTTADIFENGIKVVSATAFTPTALETLRTIGTQHPYNINQMALWATPLTDTQLTQLTTL